MAILDILPLMVNLHVTFIHNVSSEEEQCEFLIN